MFNPDKNILQPCAKLFFIKIARKIKIFGKINILFDFFYD